MANNAQTITTLHNLLNYDAQKFTSAEVLLKNNLHNWINIAASPMLKAVLHQYLLFVEQHIQQLDDFLEAEYIGSLFAHNRVMQAFSEETEEKLQACSDPKVRDAALLACVQLVNHFKISMCGTAAAFANALDMKLYATLFHNAEVNERQIDEQLSVLAGHEINIGARNPVALSS